MTNMSAKIRSSLLGGLLAAVIWMVIATLNDASNGSVVGWGLGLGVFTFAVSMVISATIRRERDT